MSLSMSLSMSDSRALADDRKYITYATNDVQYSSTYHVYETIARLLCDFDVAQVLSQSVTCLVAFVFSPLRGGTSLKRQVLTRRCHSMSEVFMPSWGFSYVTESA